MNHDMKVVKSDGKRVDIDLDKIHIMVEKACRGITGVSESLVEMNSGLQFYDDITTKEIQKILVKSASDLISLDNPNYQFVAARLLLFAIQKQVFNTKWKDSEIYPPLLDIIKKNIKLNVCDETSEYSIGQDISLSQWNGDLNGGSYHVIWLEMSASW